MVTVNSEGFKVVQDPFGGLILHTKDQDITTVEEYDARMSVAMPKWIAQGVRGFWARIPTEQSHLISVFVKYGLDFNHAKPGYVLMARWLPTSEKSMIPAYASHYLGVAGFVINDKNQVLVIKEKYHHLQKVAPWKFPGGMADPGEEIFETAKREVLEETGIEADFIGVITFRHQHKFRHNCSDFYFICLMHPSNPDQKINPCQQEIADCQWMDLDEYLADPDVTDANRQFVQSYKDSVLQNSLIISPSPVPSFNKQATHQAYSIHPLNSRQ